MNSLTLPTIPTKISKSEFGGYDCEPSSWFVGEPKPVPDYDGLFSHSVCYQKGEGHFLVASNITYEQDARLIAAAPDLLAVAEMEEALEMPSREGRPILVKHGWVEADRFELPATKFVAEKRRAAIAKATKRAA